MDVDLSSEDLAFQDDVRAFLADNAHDPKTDYGQWRMNWFEKAKAKFKGATSRFPNPLDLLKYVPGKGAPGA